MTRLVSFAAALFLFVTLAGPRAAAQAGADAALVARARAIHDRVITLDTHDDINPDNFTRQQNYTQRLETQVNLPKIGKIWSGNLLRVMADIEKVAKQIQAGQK